MMPKLQNYQKIEKIVQITKRVCKWPNETNQFAPHGSSLPSLPAELSTSENNMNYPSHENLLHNETDEAYAIRNNVCFRCHQQEHWANNCPEKRYNTNAAPHRPLPNIAKPKLAQSLTPQQSLHRRFNALRTNKSPHPHHSKHQHLARQPHKSSVVNSKDIHENGQELSPDFPDCDENLDAFLNVLDSENEQ